MRTGMLAVRYARALLLVAQEEGVEEAIYLRMKTLSEHFSAFPDLAQAIENPLTDRDSKRALLLSAAGGTDADSADLLERFINLILMHRREQYLHSIALQYGLLYRQNAGIHLATLTTALPMDPETDKQLKAQYESLLGARFEWRERVDASLLGGYILEIDQNRLDVSVSTQLRDIYRKLTQIKE